MKVIEEKKVIKSTIKLDDKELKLIKDTSQLIDILYNKLTDLENNPNHNEIDDNDRKEIKELRDELNCLYKLFKYNDEKKEHERIKVKEFNDNNNKKRKLE